MSVTVAYIPVVRLGNDSATSFSFSWTYTEANDMVVRKQDASGVFTTLVIDVDYSVSVGSITYPISGSPLPTGEKLFIARKTDLDQLLELLNTGGFHLENVTSALDKQTRILQEVYELTERAVRVEEGESAIGAIAALVANKALVVNSTGDGLIMGPTVTEVENAEGYATTASTKATEAAASALAAATDAATVAGILDTFDDRFLGEKATAPTVDNDGDALVVGTLYFKTSSPDSGMYIYDGTDWESFSVGIASALLKANNLSDLTDTSAARTNLGLHADGSNLVTNSFVNMRTLLGLNVYAISISDWDDAQSNGWYMADGASNAPEVTGWFIGTTVAHNSIWAKQTVHSFVDDTATDSKKWVRDNNNGTWTAWRRVYENADEIIGLVGILRVRDEKSNTTSPQALTAGTYVTRDLNTVDENSITGASLASNIITLPAGTYDVDGFAPSYKCNGSKCRLLNITAGSNVVISANSYSHSSYFTQAECHIKGRFTLSVSSTLRLDHIVNTASNGGVAVGGISGNSFVEIYTQLEFRKVA